MPEKLQPGDKVTVRQYDGETDKITSKVRVRSGDSILNVNEDQVTKE